MTARPRLVFIVTEDWFFASHFLGFARAAITAGFEPVVATRVTRHRAVIEASGARVVDVPLARSALGLASLAAAVRAYLAVLRAERPALVHCIALKSIVLGGIAARLARVPRVVLAPTGLGHLWIADGVAQRAARRLVRLVVAWLARDMGTAFLFENRDDIAAIGAPRERSVLVAGAGVPAATFAPAPEAASRPLRVAVVARMLRAKGILEAADAVRLARAAGADVALDVWGAPDPENPDSLDSAALRTLAAQPGITVRGLTDDVAGVWRASHIAMLLSYREGLPRALVEAAASGRPIVTTDVPGCREVVTDGVEGILVPARSPQAAADALVRLASDPALRARMGAAARRRFEAHMTDTVVHGAVEALYRSLRPR